jgi:hypothetical protein
LYLGILKQIVAESLPNTCTADHICGTDEENEYETIIECTRAHVLSQELRKAWQMPQDHAPRYTGRDWLLVLLGSLDEDMRAKIMFLWWRAWHHRNNFTFGTFT